MKVQKEIQKDKTVENGFYLLGLLLAAIVLLYYFFYKKTGFRMEKYFPPCLFHALTGYYCPGCGITRAVYALFEGKLLRCLCYHPVLPYAVILWGWFLVSQTAERLSGGRWNIGMRYRDIYLWFALALLLLNFLIKNMALLLHMDLPLL